MEKNDVDYSEYKYKSFIWHENYKEELPKKHRPKKEKQPKEKSKKHIMKMDKEGLFVVIVIFLCFSITFVLSNFVGSDGTLKFLTKKEDDLIKYYLLSLGSFTKDDNLYIYAEELSKIGGAGYIYKDDTYHIIVSVYESEDDALNVGKRLKNSNYEVIEIKISYPTISWADSDDKEVVFGALEYINTAVNTLIKIGTSLENEDIEISGAISQINTLYDEIKYLTNDFNNLTKYKDCDEYIKISAEIEVTFALLKNLLEYKNSSLELLSEMRADEVIIILGAKKMFENI